jgi:hypothetical protein
LDGTNGTFIGGFRTPYTPFVVQPSNQPLSGKVTPRYQVMALIYAPQVYAPQGATAGGQPSSVDYSTSSSTGTTVPTSQAFTDGYKVSGGIMGSLTGSFSASTTTTNSQAVTISKSSTLDIHVDGNTTVDGIDHNEDEFYLWLNPVMYVLMDDQGGIAWRLGVPDDQPNVSMNIQHVSVAQLSGSEGMDPVTKKALDNAGLDQNDYNTILALNPFSTGATLFEPKRYRLVDGADMPFESKGGSGGQTETYTLSNQNMQVSSQTAEQSYSVSVGISGTITAPFAASLAVAGSMKWTNTVSTSTSTSTTQTASATIGYPASGYIGPTDIKVYWDSLYNSFAFGYDTSQQHASGTARRRHV